MCKIGRNEDGKTKIRIATLKTKQRGSRGKIKTKTKREIVQVAGGWTISSQRINEIIKEITRKLT